MELKKITIYGDSISTGNHGNGGYIEHLKISLGLERIDNFAIGSSGLSLKTPNNMITLLEDTSKIPKDADLILIWHGTNDWYWGTEIGDMNQKDPSTFWGSIDYVVDRLRSTVPKAPLIWITPIYRYEKPYMVEEIGEGYELKNHVGYTLLDYYEVIEKASKRYGFSLIDMRRRVNIHRYNASEYLEDNVHPNEKGYQLIHRILDQELRNLT